MFRSKGKKNHDPVQNNASNAINPELPPELLLDIYNYLPRKQRSGMFANKDLCSLWRHQDVDYQLLTAFLQAVLDDNYEKVEKILKVNPALVAAQPHPSLILQSHLTWQRCYALPALTMATLRSQLNMINTLLPYFEYIPNAAEVIKQQWQKPFCTEQALGAFITSITDAKNTINIDQLKKLLFADVLNLQSALPTAELLVQLLMIRRLPLNLNTDAELIHAIGLLQSVQIPELASKIASSLDKHTTYSKKQFSHGNIYLSDNSTYYRPHPEQIQGLGLTSVINSMGVLLKENKRELNAAKMAHLFQNAWHQHLYQIDAVYNNLAETNKKRR